MRAHAVASGSPWLVVSRGQQFESLQRSIEVDVAIVGAGIAGISTAQAILESGSASVALLDAGLVACGATGHSAGQLVSGFEYGSAELCARYGRELVRTAYRASEAGDLVIRQNIATHGITCDVHDARTYVGYASKGGVLSVMKALPTLQYIADRDLPIRVRDDILDTIPHDMRDMARAVEAEEIDRTTGVTGMLAVQTYLPSLLLNPYKYCVQLLDSLCFTFADRLLAFEDSPCAVIRRAGSGFHICVSEHSVKCQRVVLATNGYRMPNCEGLPLSWRCIPVNLELAAMEADGASPCARGVFLDDSCDEFYFAIDRPFSARGGLRIVGGPNPRELEPGDHQWFLPDARHRRNTLDAVQLWETRRVSRLRLWHGRMAYTSNGLRCIGEDPVVRGVYYNMGCNGIGMALSAFGGAKIAGLIHGERSGDIFDQVWS